MDHNTFLAPKTYPIDWISQAILSLRRLGSNLQSFGYKVVAIFHFYFLLIILGVVEKTPKEPLEEPDYDEPLGVDEMTVSYFYCFDVTSHMTLERRCLGV